MSTLSNFVPVGTTLPFAGPTNKIPVGAMLCDGSTLNTTEYAKLFDIIGYVYGGSGSSFRIPDYRGVFIRGVDNGRGVDSGRALGSYQEDSTRKPRYHSFTGWTPYEPAHAHKHGSICLDWDTQVYAASASASLNTGSSGNHRHSFTMTGGDPETRPKNYATNYIIVF